MTNFVSSIAVDDVMNALQGFIINFLPADTPLTNVTRGQGNRVPMPPSPCVIITEALNNELETSNIVYTIDASQLATITGPKQINVQLDFYGESAGDYASALVSAFRSIWGFDQFPTGIRPLYTDGGREMPLVTGEEQYEKRWTVTASLQYNPAVTVPQQSANELQTAFVLAVETYNEG